MNVVRLDGTMGRLCHWEGRLFVEWVIGSCWIAIDLFCFVVVLWPDGCFHGLKVEQEDGAAKKNKDKNSVGKDFTWER